MVSHEAESLMEDTIEVRGAGEVTADPHASLTEAVPGLSGLDKSPERNAGRGKTLADQVQPEPLTVQQPLAPIVKNTGTRRVPEPLGVTASTGTSVQPILPTPTQNLPNVILPTQTFIIEDPAGEAGTAFKPLATIGTNEHFDLMSNTASVPSTTPVESPSDVSSTIYHQRKGKYRTSYVLPDGSFAANGKGLGKGRPGIKRGPRRSQTGSEGSPSISLDTELSSGPQPQSTPVTTKRKRTDSTTSPALPSYSDSSPVLSRESTPEYNPTSTQTRSGRVTQKPQEMIKPPSLSASPTTKRKPSTTPISTPASKSHPKIKRKIYRGREQFALCEHCLRGSGPAHNVIVFCDACNKCWHQRCHSPQIPREVVSDTKAEWFCSICDKILHGNKRTKKTTASAKAPQVVPTPPPPPAVLPVIRYGSPLVGAQALSREQRKTYLQSLSKDQLINLALRAGDLAPQMPIFESPLPMAAPFIPAQPQFTSNYVTPVDARPEIDKTTAADIGDEGYDDHIDEHAALYPKPGEGVQLPPENVDLHILLEGSDSKTFSHWIRGMAVKTFNDNVTLV